MPCYSLDLPYFGGRDEHLCRCQIEKLQSANLTAKNKEMGDFMESKMLSERLLTYGSEIIRSVAGKLEKTAVGRHISLQIVRAATSAGANYEEACGAESRKDFIHKMQIVLKELRESVYWLKLINKSGLCNTLDILMKEADELVRIFSSSVVTAKNNCKSRN